MKKLAEYDLLQVPDYALSYLFNGDDSGLDDEDITSIDDWVEYFEGQARELGGHTVYGLTDNDSESYFCHNPEFGKASNVVEMTVTILGK